MSQTPSPTSNPQLDIIFRMMSAFASNKNVSEALTQGLSYVQQQINAEAASFFLLDEAGGKVECHACLGPVDITGLAFEKDKGIVGRVIHTGATQFIADCQNDPNFNMSVDSETGFITKSMICAPVIVQNKTYGALQLINRQGQDPLFEQEDAALVTVLANAAALALANSEMTQNLIEAEKTNQDVRMAARVQENLFPQSAHAFAYGRNIPKKGVSGDIYDYVERGERLYFCLGDVSGKGINAALVMAKTHSLFRSLTRTLPDTPSLVHAMNRELTETASNGMFVTAIVGYYEVNTQKIHICNAGHEPALILTQGGELKTIGAHMHPLGIMDIESSNIKADIIDLSQARLFAFTDGLTEAKTDGQMLGADQLGQQLLQHRRSSLSQQIDAVVNEIHQNADMIHDDLTLLGIGQ